MKQFIVYIGILGIIITVILTGTLVYYLLPYLPFIAYVLVVVFLVVVVGGVCLGAVWCVLKLQAMHRDNHIIQAGSVVAYNYNGNLLHLSAMQAAATVVQSIPANQPVQPLALPAPTTNALPTAPTFRAMSGLISEGRLVLGYNAQGPIYGSVGDLLSMGVVGKPGTGKSSALLYYLAMLILVNASVSVLDPHGSLNELSGLVDYVDDLYDIAAMVPKLHRELDERCALYKQSRQVRKPLLVLIDEMPVITSWEEENKPPQSILKLVKRIVLEARKWNVFVILSGQSLPAEVLPTLTRDNLSSRIVFNSSASHARMIGLDEESRKRLLPMLRRAQPGTAILDVSRRAEPDIISIPLTTVEDLQDILYEDQPEASYEFGYRGAMGSDGEQDAEPFPAVPACSHKQRSQPLNSVSTGAMGSGVNVAVEAFPSVPQCSQQEKAQIIQIARVQLQTTGKVVRRDIPTLMRPKKSNRFYPVVSYVLDEAGL